jgi:membrane protein DedA with SNARE-associated domain
MEWLHEFIAWVVGVVGAWGYPGVFVLMCLESTFVPVPSELVMPPAGYLATLPPSDPMHMNVYVAVLVGTVGCMAGASINYALALWLGRPFLLRFGKYVLCPPHKFEKMERFFLTHGEIGTFTGRLILGVRHFISFPAGLARMNIPRFLFLTGLGSGIWCAILAAIGYFVGKNKDLVAQYSKHAAIGVTVACLAMIAIYVYCHRRKQAAGG